jgi:hypothetical protein
VGRLTTIILTVCLLIGTAGAGCGDAPGTKITDDDLKVWRNTLSPNGRNRIVIYQHDNGALGYGRIFWSVTAENVNGIDLSRFTLPDGYRAEGWTADNELEVSKWQPYYGIRESREIRNGDLFNGVKVRMVENNSTYPLPGYEEPYDTDKKNAPRD